MVNSLPPQNLEAEKSVLGAILFDSREAMQRIAPESLTDEHFYKNSHAAIFRGVLALHIRNEKIDILTLSDELKKRGDLETAGGLSYLTELANSVPTSAMASSHTRLIKEASDKRVLRGAAIQLLQNTDRPVDDLLKDLRNATDRIIKNQGGNIVSMRDVAKSTMDGIESRINDRSVTSGVSSGFSDIDELTDGWQPGEIYIIAARPSMGKTALGGTFALNAARSGTSVGFISVEMGERQIGTRLLANFSGIEKWRLQKGITTRDVCKDLVRVTTNLSELPIYFEFNAFDVNGLERAFMQMAELKHCQLIIVDYLQLVKCRDAQSREREVAEVSMLLKRLSKTYSIPVLVLAQLNRDVERRESKRPNLADLRDSGQIEQDADAVICLWKHPTQGDITILDIVKGRNIGLGTVFLRFNGDLQRFEPVIDEEKADLRKAVE